MHRPTATGVEVTRESTFPLQIIAPKLVIPDIRTSADGFSGVTATVRTTDDGTGSHWSAVNPLLRASWSRSRDYVTDPSEALAPIALDDAHLRELRRDHPLSAVMPVFERLLTRPAAEAGLIVAVGDARGRLLWVDGDRPTLRRAESVAFQPGADWSERAIGTSAPGTALAAGHGVQVHRSEHFAHHVQGFSCTAAPIRCPLTGEVLGVVDVTGGAEAVSTHSLPLILAAVDAAQAELRKLGGIAARPGHRPDRTAPSTPPARTQSIGSLPGDVSAPLLELTVLGAERPHLRAGPQSSELTLRHAEILTLLLQDRRSRDAAAGHGMSAEALAQALYGAPGHEVALRAELVRLRRRLADLVAPDRLEIASRPYRLVGRITSDAEQLLERLAAGDRDAALTLWSGPLLPTSESPGVAELRLEVDVVLREAMLQDADADQLWRYLDSGRDVADEELLRTALRILPSDSPRRAVLLGRATAMQR